MAKKTLKQLQDERAVKFKEADEAAKLGESRSLTTEEFANFTKLTEEVRELDLEIEQAVKLEQHAQIRALAVNTGVAGNRDNSPGDERDIAKFSLLRALNLKHENKPLDGVEAEVVTMSERAAKEDGISLQGNGLVILDKVLQKRGQTVTLQTLNAGDQGGVLVPKDVRGMLDVIQANTFLDKVGAKFLRGLTGNLEIPVQETTPTIQELTEIEEMDDDEILFGTASMTPKRRGITIPISKQTLIQASIDMEAFTIQAIGEALAQKLNAEAVSVLLTAITSGNGNLLSLGTNGDRPSYEDIVDLEALVDGVDHLLGDPVYLTNTKVKAILRTAQKFSGTNGDPVWDRDGVNGYKPVVSNIVPSNLIKGTLTNASPIIFGNFRDFLVGFWGGTEFIIDPYSAKKKGQIEITANAFWNQKVLRIRSFSGLKDAITTRP